MLQKITCSIVTSARTIDVLLLLSYAFRIHHEKVTPEQLAGCTKETDALEARHVCGLSPKWQHYALKLPTLRVVGWHIWRCDQIVFPNCSRTLQTINCSVFAGFESIGGGSACRGDGHGPYRPATVQTG